MEKLKAEEAAQVSVKQQWDTLQGESVDEELAVTFDENSVEIGGIVIPIDE